MKKSSLTFDSNLLSKIILVQQSIATAELNLNKIMDLIVQHMTELTSADGAVVELAEGEDMVYRAVYGSAINSLGARVKIAASLSGLCYRTGEVLECLDSETDSRVDRVACARIGVRSMILVPLKQKDKAVGVLKVLSAKADAFQSQDLDILKMLSGLLGAAFEKASDFELLREREEKIRNLNVKLEKRIQLQNQELEESVLKMIDLQAQQRAAAAVQQSEARLRGIFESAFDAIVGMDSNGLISHWNPKAEQIFGWSKNEVIGRKMSEVIIPENYRQAHEQGMKIFLQTKQGTVLNKSIEITALRRSGEVFPIQLSISPVLIDDNYLFTAFIADISEQKQAASQMEETRLRFQSAFEDAPIGMVIGTLDLKIDIANPSFCRMLGYTPEELKSKTFAELTVAGDRSFSRETAQQLLRGELSVANVEKRYIHKSGQPIWVSVHASPLRSADGTPKNFLLQVMDMTEKKASETSLQEASEKLNNLIQVSPLGIIAFDANRNLTLWNPACEKMFGWKKEEVLGGPLPFVPESRRQESAQIIQKMSDTSEKMKAEVRRIRKDGSEILLEISSMPLHDHDNKIFGFMAILNDITERAQREASILEANKALSAATRAKSEFLANMSHEIRTPINGVMGMASLLLDTDLNPEQKEYVEIVRSSADTLLTLVNDILDLSKAEAGKVQLEAIDFEIDNVVQDIERTLSYAVKKKGLKLFKSVSPEIPTFVNGDPTRVGQVLLNLVNNAIKFTAHGQITIDVQVVEQTSDHCRLRFEITDSGIGIPKEVIGRMFQAFTQADSSTSRKFGGTGLGLSICKHLVQLMDGEIGVDSEVGKGSTFWFTLPFRVGSQDLKAQTERVVSSTQKPRKQVRVLIAEDNSVNRTIALKMLEKMGHNAVAVANGNEVLDALRLAPYDLILMDCQMPELDGYETTTLIRKSLTFGSVSQIPIIAMTANAMSGDREKCLSVGMNDYISKPMKAKDLENVIEKVLSQTIEQAS